MPSTIMDFGADSEINIEILRAFLENRAFLEKQLSNKKCAALMFQRFPFCKFTNLPILGADCLNVAIEVLDYFSSYDEFYGQDYYDENPFNCTMDFILLTLMKIKVLCREVYSLLQLLWKILNRQMLINDIVLNDQERERILAVLIYLTNLRPSDKNVFSSFGPLLVYLLDIVFPSSLNNVVLKLLQCLEDKEAFLEVLLICIQILKRSQLSSNLLEAVMLWLMDKGPSILKLDNADVIQVLLDCFHIIILRYFTQITHIFESEIWQKKVVVFVAHLFKFLHFICYYSDNKHLRPYCMEIIKMVVLEFCNRNRLCISETKICHELSELPERIELWPQFDGSVFFFICHICVEHSKSLWSNLDVLMAINRLFYSGKYLTHSYAIKSIFFLYPVMIHEANIPGQYVRLGHDLLHFFETVNSLSYLYSYNTYQLDWILRAGSMNLKTRAVCQWLKNAGSLDVITNAMKKCNAQISLLRVITDSEEEETLGLRCAMILRALKNNSISRMVSKLLVVYCGHPLQFSNLLLINPSVPVDVESSLVLCGVMGEMLSKLSNEEVLMSALHFSKKLLIRTKNKANGVKNFCKNSSSLRVLLNHLESISENGAAEIITLFVVIIQVQCRTFTVISPPIKDSFATILRTVSNKSGLGLLFSCLRYENSILMIQEDNLYDIYNSVLKYTLSEDAQIKGQAYDCLTLLFKKANYLCCNITSSVYIRVLSLTPVTVPALEENLFRLFMMWLSVVKNTKYVACIDVPLQEMSIFFVKSSLPSYRISRFLNTLESIKNKQRANRSMYKLDIV